MDLMHGVLKESTWKDYERRYRRMSKDLEALADAGKITSANPIKITDNDVVVYLSSLRARGMQPSGINHNIDVMASLLRYVGNNALNLAKIKYPQHFQRHAVKRLDPLSQNEREMIIREAEKVQDNDWRRMEAYAICVTGICTGLRPGELRLALVTDLDLAAGVMHAEEVKGKGKYGEPRNSAIHPDGLPFLRRYLKVRGKMIVRYGSTNQFLFPAFRDERAGGDGCFSQQGMSRLRTIVKEDTGLVFDNRTCRRTYGQGAIDAGVPLDAVSRMLGHSTTKTTETHYCRRSNAAAIEEAQKVWGNAPIAPRQPQRQNTESPLIEKEKYMSGYA